MKLKPSFIVKISANTVADARRFSRGFLGFMYIQIRKANKALPSMNPITEVRFKQTTNKAKTTKLSSMFCFCFTEGFGLFFK